MSAVKSKLSHAQLLILTGFFVHCYNNLSYRFLDSFVPNLAQSQYNLTETMIGVLFASFCMAIFVSSPIWGTVCNRWGPKSVVCYGLLIEACALLALSFAGSFTDLSTANFTAFFSVLRAVEGVGSAAAQTGCYAMLAAAAGDSSGSGMGGMEMFGGIGNMMGPLIGAALFLQQGYSAPFLFMGILGFIVAAITQWSLPSKQSIIDDWEQEKQEIEQSGNTPSINRTEREASVRSYIGQLHPSVTSSNQFSNQPNDPTVSLFDVLSIPTVLYSCVVPCVALGCISFLSAQLELALKSQHNLDDVEISACFLLLSFVQLIACPLAGWASDRLSPKLSMIGGLSLMCVAMLMLGPTPLVIGSKPIFELQLVALALLGVGVSFSIIPTFTDQLKASSRFGRLSQPLIAGLSASSFSFGEVVGPIVGSALVDSYTFAVACTIVGIACLATAVLGVVLLMTNVIPWDYEPTVLIGQSGDQPISQSISQSSKPTKRKNERVIEMEPINTSVKHSINRSIQKGKQMVDRLRSGRRGYGKMDTSITSSMVDTSMIDDQFEDELIDEFDDHLVDDQVYEMDAIDAPALSVNQSHMIHQSYKQPIKSQPITHTINQSVDQSINQSSHTTNQHNEQPIKRSIPLIASPELELAESDEDQDIDIVIDPTVTSQLNKRVIDPSLNISDDDDNETSLFDGDQQYK